MLWCRQALFVARLKRLDYGSFGTVATNPEYLSIGDEARVFICRQALTYALQISK